MQGDGLHLAVNHHLNTRLNVIWEESTRGPLASRRSRYLFVFILECAIDFCRSPLMMYANGRPKIVTLAFFPRRRRLLAVF